MVVERPVPPVWHPRAASHEQQQILYADGSIHYANTPIWIQPPHAPGPGQSLPGTGSQIGWHTEEWQKERWGMERGHVAQPPQYFPDLPVDRHPTIHPQSTHPQMALPGHSPPPFPGPGSPQRSFNGYIDPKGSLPMYGPQPRSMLPPSPQHYSGPRYSQPLPPAAPPAINSSQDSRAHVLPQKRPGSAMSISSIMGTEPDRPTLDQYSKHVVRTPSRQNSVSGPPMSLSAVMSPPQQPTKVGVGEYTYKPRSRTPDKIGGNTSGVRPYRSSSGSMMERPSLYYDSSQPLSKVVMRYPDGSTAPLPLFGGPAPVKDDPDERVRRTSISGLLQRPESQPQPSTSLGNVDNGSGTVGRAESAAPVQMNGNRDIQPGRRNMEPARPSVLSGSYDTRPPAFLGSARQPITSAPRESTSVPERSTTQSLSPELRRPQLNGSDRGLAGLLNQSADTQLGSHSMARQDSARSQSDRSAFGDRARFRAYSPFAGSVASQNPSITSAAIDELGRKGSDELSQHRAILGLAGESKRGRYSPLPQAVQGAQAQTPTPDAGIKTEHGRVFAGIGSSMATTSTHTTPAPGAALPASPFKRDEGGARLSEENLLKMSRSTSGISKRSRKLLDDEARAESDIGDGKKARANKKTKYAHSYKIDLEDSAAGGRRSTPLAGLNNVRRTATPNSNAQLHHHHHLQKHAPAAVEQVPVFKPRKTIRVGAVVADAKRHPRRHLGSYKYDPIIGSAELSKSSTSKFNISIRPKLLPSFTESEQINCTYKIRVPKLWLQKRERGLICREAYLWGSGIYTDDSDPVAAAMHAGFLAVPAFEGIDETLLERVIREQNPRIEGLENPPKQPMEIDEGKNAVITLLVLPPLERYDSTTRYGVRSRDWPTEDSENNSQAPHDGVSFMVLGVEFVDGGIEAMRMGRTGVEKRQRLRMEMAERQSGSPPKQARLELAKVREDGERKTKRKEKDKHKATTTALKMETRAVASDIEQPKQKEMASQKKQMERTKLDVGGSGQTSSSGSMLNNAAGADWIQQLAVAAA